MSRPWDWVTSDCIRDAGDVFISLFGIDPVATLRGKYGSARSAMKLSSQGQRRDFVEASFGKSGLVDSRNIGAIGLSYNGGPTFDGLATVLHCGDDWWIGKAMSGYSLVKNTDVRGFHCQH